MKNKKFIRTTEPALKILKFGEGNTAIQIVIAESRDLPDFEALPGVFVLIDPEIAEEFQRWIATNQVDDIAKELGISRAKAGRLRKALGLSGSYSGGSRTTKWRKSG